MNYNLDKSREAYEKGKEYLFEVTPFAEPILTRGEGSYVWDMDGNKYLDLNAGQFCVSLGHGYKKFAKMVEEQIRKLYHTNTSTISPEVFTAAEKMAFTTNYKLTKTIFLSTGSEANECAIRYAKFITNREGVISLDKGYHGLTLASQSATMGGTWAKPKVEKSISVITPDLIHCDKAKEEILDEAIKDLKSKFELYGNECAAMILEPVLGVGGMIELPSEYLKTIRELCNQYGVILIYDECQCGFARSGEWYAYERTGTVPDILVTAKAMGMGFAVSAVTFRKEIAEQIEGKIIHFSSHQNDPLSASIVSFVIDEIVANDLVQSNKEKGEYLFNTLKKICDKTEALINPRGVGLMCAFDINDKGMANYKEYSKNFIRRMQENGVLIQAICQGRTFRLMPNYFIKQSEIDLLGEAIEKSI